MSKGARFFLGAIALLLGAMMVLIAPDDEHRSGFYVFGAFCASIGLVCFTSGRTRSFFGSVVGTCVFVVGIFYLGSALASGPVVSGSRSAPSVVNAVLFNFFFGLPGAMFAWASRFGLRRDAL